MACGMFGAKPLRLKNISPEWNRNKKVKFIFYPRYFEHLAFNALRTVRSSWGWSAMLAAISKDLKRQGRSWFWRDTRPGGRVASQPDQLVRYPGFGGSDEGAFTGSELRTRVMIQSLAASRNHGVDFTGHMIKRSWNLLSFFFSNAPMDHQ